MSKTAGLLGTAPSCLTACDSLDGTPRMSVSSCIVQDWDWFAHQVLHPVDPSASTPWGTTFSKQLPCRLAMCQK